MGSGGETATPPPEASTTNALTPRLPGSSLDRVVKTSEYVARVCKQHLAGCSQLDAAAVPTQELGADLRFQAADSLTQGRLRERQVFGGTAEAQPLGNRNEVTKVAALGHAAMLSVCQIAHR